ncbi:hypothetical protein VCRA2116O141_90099 [Vibrio crassostreae]|nr:hypothetical protein VCRA2116O141_90099 [Vibrio crassostreae]
MNEYLLCLIMGQNVLTEVNLMNVINLMNVNLMKTCQTNLNPF